MTAFAPYERSAEVYDLLYGQMFDYPAGAARVVEMIRSRFPDASSLLEVACGTGLYLEQFRQEFAVAGLDIAPQMLDRARRRLPEAELIEADMRHFHLERRFDAVVCLGSSIAYLAKLGDLTAAFRCMASHLNPGGVLVVEPWFAPDAWQDGYVGTMAARSDELAVGRVSTSVRDGRTVTMYWGFAVAYPDGSVDTYVEEHATSQFTVEEHVDALMEAGLEAEHDPKGLMGRGLYLAVKGAP